MAGQIRRVVGAFALALYAAMTLSMGVASADDGSAPRDTARADASTSQRSESSTERRPAAQERSRGAPQESARKRSVTRERSEDDAPVVELRRRAFTADTADTAVESEAADDPVSRPDRTEAPVSRESITDQRAEPRRDVWSPRQRVTVAPDPAPARLEPRLDRQLAGGLSDVGTILVSAVHATATAVAQTFGPHSFFGVPHLLATVVANTAAAVGRSLVGSDPDAVTGPFPVTYGVLDGLALFRPTKPPAGANDPSVEVTPERPLPIILLNSTVITQGTNWSVGAPVLANAGYKVYTFNYGNVTRNPNALIQSIGDIRKSGIELAAEIDRVLIETGAPQVILIGHSQGGGALPSYYINNLGGADKVSQLIGIGPGHHGTTFMGLVSLVLKLPVLRELYIGLSGLLAPAFYQQSAGSPFLDEVYGNGDTRPGVRYTTISTAYDEVATPHTRQALDGPNVTNIVLQHRYPRLLLGHLNMVTSPYTWDVVLEALADNPAANPLRSTAAMAA